MTIVRIGDEGLEQICPESLQSQGLREREDLQRLLKQNIEVIDSDLLVIAEEFGEWEDSRRRIDLLAIDRNANLVVIELKRDCSAHMELQAMRYAAMVASMSFEQVVRTYSDFRGGGRIDEAREELLNFLETETDDEDPVIGEDVRIVLVSGSFSKELTTTVLWLNERDLDIRCIQLELYQVGDALLADIRQILLRRLFLRPFTRPASLMMTPMVVELGMCTPG